jgi:hypothetical protein
LLRPQCGTWQDSLRVLGLGRLEPAQLAPGPVEDDVIAVGFVEQDVEVQEEPASLA